MVKAELIKLLQDNPEWKVQIVSDINEDIALVNYMLAKDVHDYYFFNIPEEMEIPVKVLDNKHVSGVFIGRV